jgi:hypothetical protein
MEGVAHRRRHAFMCVQCAPSNAYPSKCVGAIIDYSHTSTGSLRSRIVLAVIFLVFAGENFAFAAYTSTTAGTLIDSATQLEWDVCADNQSGSICAEPAVSKSWQQALLRVAALNAVAHKGYSDWRMPNKNELESLVDLARMNPATTPQFLNAPSGAFWSSTINIKNYGQAWAVNFADGSVLTQSGTAYLRVVRGGSTDAATDRLTLTVAPSPFEVITANNTVYDPRTLLRWDRCPFGVAGTNCDDGTASTFTWQQALQLPMLANVANHKGFSDWRLPNKNEMESIVDLTVLPPSIEAAIFPNTPLAGFFTSTLNMKNFGQAWKVNFNDGSVYTDAHGNVAPVRLVRDGGTSASTDRLTLPTMPSPFEVSPNAATVYDPRTLLRWDRCPWGVTGAACTVGAPSSLTWQQALQLPMLANAANHKGFSDWRLPNKNEMESIVDLTVLPPSIEAAIFPNTPLAGFFTSTLNMKNFGQAWKVNFNDGSVYTDAHGNAQPAARSPTLAPA